MAIIDELVGDVSFKIEIWEEDNRWKARAVEIPESAVASCNFYTQARAHILNWIHAYMQISARSQHQIKVDKFMMMGNQAVPRQPVLMLDDSVRILRAKLVYEEAMELIRGLGVRVDDWSIEREMDLVEVADGCFDLRVVTTGCLSALGIPDLEGQRVVDENNLAKFGPGSWVREDGKIMKPPGHKAPDLSFIWK